MTNAISEARTVNTWGLKNALRTCVKARRPVMIWGPAGIGKSDTVAELCQEMNGILYDIRLSLLEPTDLRGIPFYNKDAGRMDWAPPVDLPDAETASQHDVVFVFFDEVNSAAPSVQAACYQIALNRRVGQYSLPDNAVIIMAGNREGDRGVTFRMPAPLANRMVHLELRVDFDPWHEWAVRNQIHPDVVGFLNFSKNSLYDFDPKSPQKAFATPRSWKFVSDLLGDPDCSEDTFTDLVCGTVGEGLGLKFIAHRRIASSLPAPSDVLSGTTTDLKKRNEISVQYSLSISCCYELLERLKATGWKSPQPVPDDWLELVDNFLGFCLKNFQPEVVVMAMRLVISTYQLPVVPHKLKNFQEFYERFGKYVLQATASAD